MRFNGLVGTGQMAWVRVKWRLPGLTIKPQQLQLHSASGEVVELHVVHISSEETTLLFEPLPCADDAQGAQNAAHEECFYLLYYLPYVRTCETGPSRACSTPYKLSVVERECAGHHGSSVGDPVCCGQRGAIDRRAVTCPRRAPTCVGYVGGVSWGQCVAE